MCRNTIRYAVALAAALVLPLSAARASSDVEEFYRGKSMELLIGFGPGGGNDVWGRVIGRHIGRHIPGNPTIVPKNVPAAGSLVVANTLARAAPKDGSVIGMVARGIPFEPLFGGKGTQFDALKFNYIGSPSRDSNMCAVWHSHPVQTAQDLFTQPTVIGSTGSGAESHVFPLLLENLIGMKVKIIKGYKGSQDIILAIERRELDGLCLGTETVRRTSQYAEGKFRIVLQMATEPDPTLGTLPLVTAFAKTAADRAALDLVFARIDLGRPFVAPPEVPAERVAALRAAFMKTMDDPAFKAEVAALKFEITATSGEKLEQLVRDAYATSPDVVKRTMEIIGQ